MPYTQLNQLDFNNIKVSLRDYLRANSDFTDYDFEGSTLSALLDLLAYNTYYTAFNTNMVANEMFLDSATLRDNVVAIAKQLGYRPKSTTASKAVVDLSLVFTSIDKPSSVLIKRGTAFNATFQNSSYPYSILEDTRVPVNNDTASFEDLEIYSGTIVTETTTVNTALKNQRFLIKNQKVDTTSIRVRVFENSNSYPSGAFDLYDYAENILNVTPSDRVFYLSEIEDENYEIKFGDGAFGRKLENGELVEISYLVTFAAETNGAKIFTFSGIVEEATTTQLVTNNYTFEVGKISLVSASSGGEDIESIDKIKFNAAKTFGTQNRAVTSEDYKAIVRNIYPAIADITAYGGEEDDPPEYGVVKLVVKPKNTPFLTSYTKKQIESQLKKYCVAGIQPKIVDPSILYIEMESKIYYDTNKTTYKNDKIRSLVLSNLENYLINSNTEKFNGKFRFSKISGVIDESDTSIKSNLTAVTMRKDFYPALNSKFYYEICFKNAFKKDCEANVVSSTGFKVREYPLDIVYFEDRAGKIVLYKLDSVTGEKIVLKYDLGDVNYEKGEIRLYDLIIIKGSFSDDKIEIRTKPAINDIASAREMFIDVDISKSKFTIIQE